MVFSAPCTEYKPYIQMARDAHKKFEEDRTNLTSESVPVPSIDKSSLTSVRSLSQGDIIDIINGSAAFAGGGGGSKQYGMLILEDAVKLSSTTSVCSQISIQDMDDKESVIPFAFMGKPTAIQQTPQMLPVLASVTIQGYEKQYGTSMKYVCGVECGPTNSVAPMFAAAYSNNQGKTCYVLDGDLQGRAVLSLSMLGPYMMGVPMTQTIFAYVSKDGNPIPNTPVLGKGSYVDNGYTYYIYASVTPDKITTAAETEQFLGGMIGLAKPDSCLAVAFTPLSKEVLLQQNHCSGVKAQIFTPNTLTRSREMGISLRTLNPNSNPWKVLSEHNAVFLCTGNIKKLYFPDGPDARSDIGLYYMIGENNFQYAGVFNNETVEFGIIAGTNDILPILDAPSAITVQLAEPLRLTEFTIERGECLTNDEMTLIFTKYGGLLSVLKLTVFAMPPAPFLTSTEALAMIGPKSWGVPTTIGPYKTNITNYIPIPATYKAPSGEGFVQMDAFGQVVPYDPTILKAVSEKECQFVQVQKSDEETRDN